MATYVEGEAAETDSSDDEQYVFNLSYMKVMFQSRNNFNFLKNIPGKNPVFF